MSDYFLQRNFANTERLRAIREELPTFCAEFFLGIEQQTTSLTRLNYAHDLKVFFDFAAKRVFRINDPKKITLEMLNRISATDIELFIEYLSYYKDLSGKTHANGEKSKARYLATIRSMYKYFFNKDKLDANTAAKVAQPKIHTKDIIRLEADEVAKLLDEAESGEQLSKHQSAFHEKTKIRDVAILSLFLGTGIRISELIGLNVEDVDFKENSFRVTRKGGNQVILYFSNEVRDAMLEWVKLRDANPYLKQNGETALFTSLQDKRISVRAVENIVKKYARIVSPLKKISPHKLRSTYGTNLYRETQDIYVVAEVLGHKDVNTTKKHYAAISEDIRRNAANKVVLRDDKKKYD